MKHCSPTLAATLPALVAALAGLVFGAGAALAQRADVPGSSDHPLVGRYEGAAIIRHAEKAFEEVVMVTRPVDQRGRDVSAADFGVTLEGRYTRIVYRGPENRSLLEVMRNLRNELASKGFQSVFACRRAECGVPTTFFGIASEGGGFAPQWNTHMYEVLRGSEAGADVWVSLYGIELGGGSRPVEPVVAVRVLEASPMEEGRVVFVDAASMKSAMDEGGKVALYGITFDFDSAALRPESGPTLAEIAALLKAEPELGVVVTGHTDASGGFDYNIDLSRRRAAAVVTALTQMHGISRERMTPFGAGMAAPVASNATEEGRALNRRVELVRRP